MMKLSLSTVLEIEMFISVKIERFWKKLKRLHNLIALGFQLH